MSSLMLRLGSALKSDCVLVGSYFYIRVCGVIGNALDLHSGVEGSIPSSIH